MICLLLVGFGVIVACNKKWDNHDAITDSAVANNLYQAIKRNSNLSKFSELLEKSGYSKIISSSKSYTVWAPSNQALASLDPAIANDSVQLRAFVGNHISNLSYTTSASLQRIPMLNGKFNRFSSLTFDSANISTPNLPAANGVYHIIDKFIPRIDNCWEFLNNSTSYPLCKSAFTSLNYNFFDSTKATQIATDPLTGNPIWDSTNAVVLRNSFLDKVSDISDESKEYTLFVLNDAGYNSEYFKLSPWFVTNNSDSTKNLTSSYLIKDLVVKGSYTPDQLPDTLTSTQGVKIPIDKSRILASYKTSNGYVHVLNKLDFNLVDKFPPIIIQGEYPTSFATTDRGANTFYRTRNNPNTGLAFYDILMQNYGFSNYYIRYALTGIPAMKYNASWVAINDVQTSPLWLQRLAIGSSQDTTLPVQSITYKNYNEVPLGEFEITSYRYKLNLYVVGPSGSSTTGGNNSISLDYIKLTPAF